MNITLLAAIASLVLWVVLVFVAHIGAAAVQLLWAAAALLFARRILVGAPRFRS